MFKKAILASLLLGINPSYAHQYDIATLIATLGICGLYATYKTLDITCYGSGRARIEYEQKRQDLRQQQIIFERNQYHRLMLFEQGKKERHVAYEQYQTEMNELQRTSLDHNRTTLKEQVDYAFDHYMQILKATGGEIVDEQGKEQAEPNLA